jgi:hypothetical protein
MTVLAGDVVAVEGDGFTMFRTDDDGWVTDLGWICDDPDIWRCHD